MDYLKEIQSLKNITKNTIDMLCANLSRLEKVEAVLEKNKQLSSRAVARKRNKNKIMQDIISFEIKPGKPAIAKRK